MNDVRARAERLLREPVRTADLALAFDETVASTVDVQVGGRNFFPPMLEDIGSASSSIHINQFGFRPGAIGEQFATALLAKASEGVAVRLVVDGQGSRPDGSGREFYERLLAGGVEVRVVRATRPWARPPARRAAEAWDLGRLGHFDHRKFVVVDGRIGWIGGAGVEDHFDDGRFHDLFVRVTGPVVSQLQLVFVASFRWLGRRDPVGRSSTRSSPPTRTSRAGPGDRAAQRAGELPPDHDRHRATARRRARDARRGQPLRHRPRR